jgi:6-phosphogluconolactonase (cycloisomerase 2 family)
VFVANHGSEQDGGGSIAGFSVNLADGSLSPVPGSPWKTGNGPAVVASDPQGRFVFVGEDQTVPGARGSNCLDHPSLLLVERVDPVSGTLTQMSSTTLAGACVRAMTVDPSGNHLYVGVARTTGTGGEIHGFLIGASGALTKLSGSPVAVADLPESLAMHPSGKFVYAATPNLAVLDRESATGKLTVRGVFNTFKRQLALNPAGTFLVASERGANEISEFFVDDNGDIVATGNRQPALTPFAVAADPQGQFFAVTEFTNTASSTGGLSTLKLGGSNGEYSKTSTAPFGSGAVPAGVAFEPTGKFVYSVFHDGTIAGFVLDRSLGTLTPIAAKPFVTGDNPDSLTIVQPR